MIDSMPPATAEHGTAAFEAEPVLYTPPPPVKVPRRGWVILVVGGFTFLVVVAFAVFALGIVGASAAGGCGGP
jgi:hypothetical protein